MPARPSSPAPPEEGTETRRLIEASTSSSAEEAPPADAQQGAHVPDIEEGDGEDRDPCRDVMLPSPLPGTQNGSDSPTPGRIERGRPPVSSLTGPGAPRAPVAGPRSLGNTGRTAPLAAVPPTQEELNEALRVLQESAARVRRSQQGFARANESRLRLLFTLFVVCFVIATPPALLLWVLLLFVLLTPCVRGLSQRAAARAAEAAAAQGAAAPGGPGPDPPGMERIPVPAHVARVLASQRGRELNLAHLRLMMLDRDFGNDDYEMLVSLDRVQEVIDQRQRREREAGAIDAALSGIARGPFAGGRRAAGAGGDKEAPSCVVCIEDLADGEEAATLPCMHQFHWACIKEWVETRGAEASCPICKLPLIRSGAGAEAA